MASGSRRNRVTRSGGQIAMHEMPGENKGFSLKPQREVALVVLDEPRKAARGPCDRGFTG